MSGKPMTTTRMLIAMLTTRPSWSSVVSSRLKPLPMRRPSAVLAKAPSSEMAPADRKPIYIVARTAPVMTICADRKRAKPI